VFEDAAMTNPAKRRRRPAKGRPPRRSLSARELALICAALVLGLAGGLAVMAGFGLDLGAPQRDAIAERAATPVAVAVMPAADPVSDPAPAADVPAVPEVSQVEDKRPEPAAPAAGRDPESPPVPAPTPGLPAAKAAARPRAVLSESDLRKQLYQAPEVGLKPSVRDGLAEKYKTSYQSNTASARKPIFGPSTLVSLMPSAQQLPLRGFPNCQLTPDGAVQLGVHSRALHAYLDALAPKDATGKRGDPKLVRDALRQERRGKPPPWLRPEALPAMVQILMAEDVPLRLILVDMMADIPGKAAGIRLAQRAVYDLSPEVRKAAIEALRQRPAGEARRTLVSALRYPWPAAADHAADALVALGDRDAAPLMVALLDKPDPAAPYATKSGASVHELVRLNHVQNCLLCHVPATGRDAVTDVDPFARRPSQTYEVGYRGPSIPGSSGGVWANKVLIRADVQFLRQDFSVTLPPVGSYSTAGGLRFDFLVRTRPLKPAEVREWKNQSASTTSTYSEPEATLPAASNYPQREATLYALRAVTGCDAGPTSEAWLKLFPNAHADAEGMRLGAALTAARPDQREQLLARYRDAKEDHYTEGLAHAIPHVSAKFQEKVRAALVERLIRLPAEDLRAYLENDGELRLAAVRACARKADAEMVPDLIGLLTDEDSQVGEAAREALRRLTREEFGPPAGAPEQERDAAAAKWEAWYRQHSP
jgi:HEAT repeat protein